MTSEDAKTQTSSSTTSKAKKTVRPGTLRRCLTWTRTASPQFLKAMSHNPLGCVAAGFVFTIIHSRWFGADARYQSFMNEMSEFRGAMSEFKEAVDFKVFGRTPIATHRKKESAEIKGQDGNGKVLPGQLSQEVGAKGD